MTNTKFRKRVLLSSVAMLLVALVALGSATFAWFTQNTTATADNIYAKTVKASTLLISKADKDWKTAVSYTQGSSTSSQIMFPASSGNGTAWFEATSDDESTGVLKTGTVKSVTPAGTNAKFVYSEMLNVKNGGDAGSPDISNITIQWSWPTGTAQYARIALVECNAEGTTFTGTFANSVYAQNTTQYAGITSVSGSGTSQTTTTANITPKSTTSVSVGTLAAGAAKYYKLFVWFEGQDAACIDSNAGQTFEGLEFTVTGTPGSN